MDGHAIFPKNFAAFCLQISISALLIFEGRSLTKCSTPRCPLLTILHTRILNIGCCIQSFQTIVFVASLLCLNACFTLCCEAQPKHQGSVTTKA